MKTLKILCSAGLFKSIIKKIYQPENIVTEAFGLIFKNPVGLAAGFDKNAIYLAELETLGFGFVEIGTVTPLPQKGNNAPRLFRLPKDKALINRMGFNNDGAVAVAKRLKEWRNKPLEISSQKSAVRDQQSGVRDQQSAVNYQLSTINYQLSTINYPRLIIGGNIGKNKITPNEDAWKDYEVCFKELFDCVDYFVVNVSSPNTPGLRELQQKDHLKKILSNLQSINHQEQFPKPLLLKISPDLTKNEIDDVIELCLQNKLHGIVVANTSTVRENLLTAHAALSKIGAGGLSGRPLREISDTLTEYIINKTAGQLTVIGSGGIFSGNDAAQKKKAGATLLQVWTGFIYEGPSIIKNICTQLKHTI